MEIKIDLMLSLWKKILDFGIDGKIKTINNGPVVSLMNLSQPWRKSV